MISPLARTYIWAAKMAKERAALTDWMKKRLVPGEEPLALIEMHRKLWRASESER